MTTIATLLIAPAGEAGGEVYGQSGTFYQIDTNGFVTITVSGDVNPLLNAGFRFATRKIASQTINASGLITTPVQLSEFRNITGAALAAAAAAGVFGYTATLGTFYGLVTEAANNNTKTDAAMYEYVIPADYIAGQNLTVNVNTTITIGSGTLSAKTVQVKAYALTAAGVSGADIGPGAATTIAANTATTTSFTITGTGLVPGQRLLLEVIMVLTETASSNVTATVNSVSVG